MNNGRSPRRVAATVRLIKMSQDRSTFLSYLWALLWSVNCFGSQQNWMWLWAFITALPSYSRTSTTKQTSFIKESWQQKWHIVYLIPRKKFALIISRIYFKSEPIQAFILLFQQQSEIELFSCWNGEHTHVMTRVSSPGSLRSPSTNTEVLVKLWTVHICPSSILNLWRNRQCSKSSKLKQRQRLKSQVGASHWSVMGILQKTHTQGTDHLLNPFSSLFGIKRVNREIEWIYLSVDLHLTT